jgi:hypothetical protein
VGSNPKKVAFWIGFGMGKPNPKSKFFLDFENQFRFKLNSTLFFLDFLGLDFLDYFSIQIRAPPPPPQKKMGFGLDLDGKPKIQT